MDLPCSIHLKVNNLSLRPRSCVQTVNNFEKMPVRYRVRGHRTRFDHVGLNGLTGMELNVPLDQVLIAKPRLHCPALP